MFFLCPKLQYKVVTTLHQYDASCLLPPLLLPRYFTLSLPRKKSLFPSDLSPKTLRVVLKAASRTHFPHIATFYLFVHSCERTDSFVVPGHRDGTAGRLPSTGEDVGEGPPTALHHEGPEPGQGVPLPAVDAHPHGPRSRGRLHLCERSERFFYFLPMKNAPNTSAVSSAG